MQQCLSEAAHDLIRPMLGACEDKGAVDLFALQDLGEHGCFRGTIYSHNSLFDTGDSG